MILHADPAVQLLLDRAAIRDVNLRYARCVDLCDFDGVAACFTPDVSGDFAGAWRPNRDELVEFISGVVTFHTTMHMMGNHFIEVDGDLARLESLAMLTHHGTKKDGGEWQLNNSNSLYVEELVRGPDGWAIQRRGGEPAWSPNGVGPAKSADPAVDWLLDRARLQDAIHHYALAVDRRDYAAVDACFAPEFAARYYDEREIRDTREHIDYVRGVEQFESTTHFFGTPLLHLDGDEALVEALAYNTRREAREGKKPRDHMLGGTWYRDRWKRHGDTWRIVDRELDRSLSERRARVQPEFETDDPDVRTLLDRSEISDLVSLTGRSLDHRDFDILADCFAPSSERDDFVARQASELTKWERARHLVGNPLLAVDGDTARAESYVYRTHHDTPDDPASRWSDGALRWVDDFVRGPEGWRIARREVASNHRLPPPRV